MKNPVSARLNAVRITLTAMMIALFAVLSLVPSEVSWASLVGLLCAFLFGPIETLTVVLCGSFIEQLWYGISWYSLLWMLPWALFGLCCGLGAYRIRSSNSKHAAVWTVVIIVISELLLNVANTTVLCYMGYVTIDFSQAPYLILWAYLLRMPHALIRAVLSSVAVPLLLPPLRRALQKHRS